MNPDSLSIISTVNIILPRFQNDNVVFVFYENEFIDKCVICGVYFNQVYYWLHPYFPSQINNPCCYA